MFQEGRRMCGGSSQIKSVCCGHEKRKASRQMKKVGEGSTTCMKELLIEGEGLN